MMKMRRRTIKIKKKINNKNRCKAQDENGHSLLFKDDDHSSEDDDNSSEDDENKEKDNDDENSENKTDGENIQMKDPI